MKWSMRRGRKEGKVDDVVFVKSVSFDKLFLQTQYLSLSTRDVEELRVHFEDGA